MLRRTYVEIDLAAIKHNLQQIRRAIGGTVKILLPVKADAYGHGLKEVSLFTQKEGLVDMLGVASASEGIELRLAGVDLPILVLGLTLPDEDIVDTILDYNLSQTVADLTLPELIAARAPARKNRGFVHLKVDTGMGRIGCSVNEAREIARGIARLKAVTLEGIFSHFPAADNGDPGFTRGQIAQFRAIISDLKSDGIEIPLKHLANSAGLVNFPDSHFDMVRPGIMSYGLHPAQGMVTGMDLVPAMTLKSNIVFIKKVPAGTPLSYGLTFVTRRESRIATVPLGYGDGYSRFLSNRAAVLINGKAYPVVGRVSMDQILIDLGDDDYPPGQEVVLFGRETITAETLAQWIGTIPYEVTCGISKRVQRTYVR
jgi:alanine racemase